MYIYEEIAFRAIERADLEILRSLHNDPSTYMNLLNIDFIDEENQQEWWKNLHKVKNDMRLALCFASSPQEVFGRLRIQNINTLHRNCEIGLDIRREYRQQGLGRKSYAMLLRFLFEEMNMRMVYLRVAEFNPEARDLYRKCGFRETGSFPQFFFRHGRFWDYILMCITREEYLSIGMPE